jgi:hypothetical protein
LIYGRLEDGWISKTRYWSKFHREWGGGQTRKVSDVKTLSRTLIKSNAIPDFAYFVNGHFYDLNWNITNLESLLENVRDRSFIVKRDFSERGRHVLKVSVAELLAFDFHSFGNSVIQNEVLLNTKFDYLSSDSPITLRIMTGINTSKGNINVIGMLLRYQEIQKDSTVRVPVDCSSLKLFGYYYDSGLKRRDLDLSGYSLDFLASELTNAVDLVLECHKKFPHFKVIGWDVGIDIDGRAWIFEWNADHPAIDFQQALHGAIFVNNGVIRKSEI